MKKNVKKVKIVVGALIVLLVVTVGVGYYFYSKMNKIIRVDPIKETGITSEVVEDIKAKNHIVKNILIAGVDKQEGATDSMIVLSLDETAKKVKITSVMRDTYVDLGSGKVPKLNYAYKYGGMPNTVKAINENFKLDITDYIKVDFESLAGIIDGLGGVNINVKTDEIAPVGVKKAGMQLLSGKQALAYSRIRDKVTFDYGRTQRQRDVITNIFSKLKESSFSKYLNIYDKVAPDTETTLSNSALMDVMKTAFEYRSNGIMQNRVPTDAYKHDTMIDNWYYMKWDKEPTIELLHKFIYED